MIELPEAVTIARQIDAELKGRRIVRGDQGNSPHKFAFCSGTPEEYESILAGKTISGAEAQGMAIVVSLEPDYALVLGTGGERILLHENETTLPAKRQLLLEFDDGTFLTVSISGWGLTLLLPSSEAPAHWALQRRSASPISDEFTPEHFLSLFGELREDSRDRAKSSVKYFAVNRPGIWGLGNGYLQDVLFRARIHPQRRALDLSGDERRALYDAIRITLTQAVSLNGRDTERDLHNRPGSYTRILDSKAVGRPCPNCATPIEKISFLGGASYFCPKCQV